MFTKLKAGALQLTIFIIVVIALLLSSFLIFVHTQKQFENRTEFVLETIENANRGISYALKNKIRANDTIVLNFEDVPYQQVKVHRGAWGIFEKLTAVSTIRNNRFQKIALVGAAQPETNRTALYIENNNKPLIVVGKTSIYGTAYLPEQGVRPGNISGESYYGGQLVHGPKRPSSKLPRLSWDIRKHIDNMQQTPWIESENQILNLARAERVFQNSFFNPVKIIYSASEITLSNIQLSGHIAIHSDTKITVMPSTKIKDLILTAPVIEIKDNVTGSFQTFATDEIIVGKNCLLDYPSALVLNDNFFLPLESGNDSIPKQIRIKENTHIKGAVAYLGQYDPTNYVPQITLEKNTLVKGEVYCMENLELNGNVEGSVYTANFIVPRFGTIYQNHLYNSKINIHKLPSEYVGLLFGNSKKAVIKWLY